MFCPGGLGLTGMAVPTARLPGHRPARLPQVSPQSVISLTSACHIFKTPPSPKRLFKVVPSARLHCLWGEANRVGREGGGDNSHPRPRQREVGPRGVRISPRLPATQAQGPPCWARGTQALHGAPRRQKGRNNPDGQSRQPARCPALRSRTPTSWASPSSGLPALEPLHFNMSAWLSARIRALNQRSPTFLA